MPTLLSPPDPMILTLSMLAALTAPALTFAACEPLPLPLAARTDTMVRVDDLDLHFVVWRGDLPVTVLLEAGGGSDLTGWKNVPEMLADRVGATIVAYDRAGLGGSGPGRDDLTPVQEIVNLREALACLRVPDRTVVVAQSYGAMLAVAHAARYPTEVVGLVMVDPMNARFIRATGDFIFSTAPDIDRPADEWERTVVRMGATFPALIDEAFTVEPGLEQPMTVITAGEAWWGRPEIDAAWRSSHEAMAGASGSRDLVLADGSNHDVAEMRPDVVLNAVERILQRVGVR